MSLFFWYIVSVGVNLLSLGTLLFLPAYGSSLLKDPPNSIRECLGLAVMVAVCLVPALVCLFTLHVYWQDLSCGHRFSVWLDKPFREEK
jgi:hypothetical protein